MIPPDPKRRPARVLTASAFRASILVLAATLFAPASSEAAEPAPPAKELSVVCRTFLERQDWSPSFWSLVVVEIHHRGVDPATLRLGAVPVGRRGRARRLDMTGVTAVMETVVEPGVRKRFFLYIPPLKPGAATIIWETNGVLCESSFLVDYSSYDPTRKCLVAGTDKEARNRIAASLKSALLCHAVDAGDLPDRPEGLDQFHTVILHDFDSASLNAKIPQALKDWTVRGGMLVLSPGINRSVFLDPVLSEIHPFRAGRRSEARSASAFGALQPGFDDLLRPAFEIEGGEVLLRAKDGTVLARRCRAGLGSVVAFATSLEVLEGLSPAGTVWFTEYLLLQGNRAFQDRTDRTRFGRGEDLAPEAGDGVLFSSASPLVSMNGHPVFRYFLITDPPRYINQEYWERYRIFLSAMVRTVAGTPGIGFVSFFLLLFVAVAGPLNYWLLRRRRWPALSALSIPLISVAFVVLVVMVGLFTKGGTRGNRITLLETRSGQSHAASTGITYFRTGAGGEYGFTVGEGVFPLPAMATTGVFRLEQTGEDRLVLPMDRWTVSGFQTEKAIALPGSVEVEWMGNGVRIANRLPFTLRGGVITPPYGLKDAPRQWLLSDIDVWILARGIDLAPGEVSSFSFDSKTTPDQVVFLEPDERLLAVLLEHQRGALGRGGFAAWIDAPFLDVPRRDGEPLPLAKDRAVLLVPLEGGMGSPAGGAGGTEPRRK